MEDTVVGKKENSLSHLFHCDYLRVFAAFCVIVIHVCAQCWDTFDVNSTEWLVLNVFEGITRWAVPVFVMISGTLLLQKDIPIGEIYSHNIVHILSAFIFWSVFYCIFNKRTGTDILFHLLVGNHHMWYIAMIIGLYICVPIIRKISESTSLSIYYLLLWLIFSSVIPFFVDLSAFSGSTAIHTIRAGVTEQLNNMNLGMITGYSGFFILGFFLYNQPLSKRKRYLIYFLGALGACATIVLNVHFSVYMQSRINGFFDCFALNILLEAVAVYTWFLYNTQRTTRLNTIMAWVSRHCFGIYLVHAFVLDLLDHGFGFNSMSFHPVISIPLVSCFVFIISLLLTWLLKKIPIIGKMIT